MANKKWSVYEIVGDSENLIHDSNDNVLEYNFPKNETDVDKKYIVKYKNGSIEKSIEHRVVAGSCVTKPTKCSCQNIIMDSNEVFLDYNKDLSTTKQCFVNGGCQVYVKSDNPEWLFVEKKSENDFIYLKTLTSTRDDRSTVVRVYYDEEMQNECKNLSFNVTQKAKLNYNIYYYVEVTNIEKFQLYDLKLYVNNSLFKKFNFTGGPNTKASGYTSGVTTVQANSIREAISKVYWYDDDSEISYHHLGFSYTLRPVGYEVVESDKITKYEAKISPNDSTNHSIKCREKPTSLCACGMSHVSENSGPGNYDVEAIFEINGGECK